MQEEDPGTLWPPTQAEQELVAPVEKVLEGHTSTPVLSALTFVPAPFVEQNAAPEEEKLPSPLHSLQPAKLDAPLSLNFPAGQGTSERMALSQ